MALYRKKPVTVHAQQYTQGGELPAGVVFVNREDVAPLSEGGDRDVIAWCATLEGGHIVSDGDWIITGVKGERYPCKPDVFEATYDPVEETDGEE